MIQVLVYFLKLRKTFNDKYWDLDVRKKKQKKTDPKISNETLFGTA